jgi:AAA15 family ATPase/GTPase
MEHFIKDVDIHNFKSIRDLRLEDCRRINLFLGYPNVGKSNVLEALGLFSVPYLNRGENLNRLVRIENAVELFHYSSEQNQGNIDTNLHKMEIVIKKHQSEFPLYVLLNDKWYYHFSEKNKYSKCTPKPQNKDTNIAKDTNIKRYTFNLNNKWKSNKRNQLLPPFGENIVDTLSYNPNMDNAKAFIRGEFAKYGLKLLLKKDDKSLLIQPNSRNEIVLLLPYSSIADTLQRVIFYKTAIASNQHSVLLFEEPEAHAFPPYIRTITQDIIDAKTNQFFIVTHSPFIVNDFLEYADVRKEVSIYLFDFKNDQTTAKRLTDEEMDEVYNYGIDLFFNIESFLRDE